MEFFEHLISPPLEQYLFLLKEILVAISVIHFAYIAIVTGGVVYSISSTIEAKGKSDELLLRWSHEMAEIAFPHKSIAIIFGVIPLLCIAVIQAQILYGSGLQTPLMTIAAAILLIIAFSVINAYNRSFAQREEKFTLHLCIGIMGALLLFAAYFTYYYGTELVLFYQQRIGSAIFITNLAFRYAHFLTLSLAIAGAGALFFRTPEKGGGDSGYEDYLKQKVLRFTSIFTVLQGILGLLVLLTMAYGARSVDVVGPESLTLLLILALVIMYYRSDLGFDMPVFAALVLILAMTFVAYESNSETATRMHTKQLVAQAREIEKANGVLVPETVPEGKEIFRNACASCHGYDKRLTGPPMKDILPRYAGKMAELEAFINNPRRVNPDYPPMPKPAILNDEVNSVSEYLLDDYLKENQGKR